MSTLVAALTQLRQLLSTMRLPFPLPDAAASEHAASRLRDQLDDYILPRLARLDAPLLVVVGGSTGAGKSTLVNSLIGRRVTAPGVIRPTTRAPVLVHHPSDEQWFGADRILPTLARTTADSNDTHALRLVAEATLPPGLAIVDAPDVDSVVTQNRDLAAQLLAAADLWLFVTSAARYADAVPWGFLQEAASRSAVVAVVLDRVPPMAMSEIPAHLGELMTERGLDQAPLFAVPETVTDEQGLLPDSAVSPLRGWLARLAADRQVREAVVRRTLDGAIGNVVAQADVIARCLDDQAHTLNQLRDEVDASYAEAVRTIAVQSADGSLMRGEVLARWQEFVGTGEILRKVEEGVGKLRDRLTSWFRGRPAESDDLQVAVESGLEALIVEESAAAAERAERSWRAHVAGRYVLDQAGPSTGDALSGPTPDFDVQVTRAIHEWQRSVMDLVSSEGMSRRSRARLLALGVNSIGVALMILVFSQTGGLVGAEIGVAGGTAVVAQRLLEAIFGDDAVRRLATRAKQELDDRIQSLMAGELLRYHHALDVLGIAPTAGNDLRTAAHAVDLTRADTNELATSTRHQLPAAAPSSTAGICAQQPALGTGSVPVTVPSWPAAGQAVQPPVGASELPPAGLAPSEPSPAGPRRAVTADEVVDAEIVEDR